MSPTLSGSVIFHMISIVNILILQSSEYRQYKQKEASSNPNQSSATVNLDVLNTVLLSLHPPMAILMAKDLSPSTRVGLAEMLQLQDLIQLDFVNGYDGYGSRLVSLI